MAKILLYSPDIVGHPRVYCRVIADVLSNADCELVVAMGFTDGMGIEELPDLQPLMRRGSIRILDTRVYSRDTKQHLNAEELVELQNKFKVDTTLFIEADKFNTEFTRIAAGQAPRLSGRNLGIFANTAEWYPGEDSFTGERCRILASTLRTTIGNIKRAIFNRKQSLKYFYENILIGKSILDEIFVKDERLATWRGPPVYWMPEISRSIDTEPTAKDAADFLSRKHELEIFLAANKSREPVLYFGDAAYYKGYDLFLQFIASTPSTCAIHAGCTYDSQQYSYFQYDVNDLRIQLHNEGRLYETNTYVHTQQLKELYFSMIRLYITTHRLALSSATVIQALELGKPVLVPDRGLLGYRVRTNELGGVYEYGNLADLSEKASRLLCSDLSQFSASTNAFWNRFSDKSIREFFMGRLLRSSTSHL